MSTPQRGFFAMVPRAIELSDLDVYAFRLYAHLKAVIGETDGECWQSTRTLASGCRMSMGKVSQAKRTLLAHGLITVRKLVVQGGRVDLIRLNDIWERNLALSLEAGFVATSPASEPAESAPPVSESVASAPPASAPAESAHPVSKPVASASPASAPAESADPVSKPVASVPLALAPAEPASPVSEPAGSAPPVSEPAGPVGAQCGSVQPVNASGAVAEISVHDVNTSPQSVHPVAGKRSPGETKKIPDKKSSSGDGSGCREDPEMNERKKAVWDRAEVAAINALVGSIAALYAAEIGQPVTRLLLGQIRELAGRCPDLEVWRAAFVRSLGMEKRWGYVVVCVKEEIRKRAVEARRDALRRAPGRGGTAVARPAATPQAGDRPLSDPSPPHPPASTPAARDPATPSADAGAPEALWQRALEVLQGTTLDAVYDRWFARTRVVGADGSSWQVEVDSPLAVDALAHPGLRKLVARAMAIAGLPEVEVVYVAPTPAPSTAGR